MTERTVQPIPVPEGPLTAPSANGGLVDVFRRRYLLKLLVQKEIQARYQASLLGLLWSYVQPLVRFCMYFFVIGLVLQLHKDIPNFAIHMFAGLVFVSFFTETFTSGTRSVIRNKAILRKMAMPREMFPAAAVIVSAIHMLPQLLILLVAAVAVGITPDATGVAAGFLGFGVIALFGTGLALMFSAFNVFFRDFQQVVATLTIFTHWAVPMIYPYSRLAESDLGGTWVETLYLVNPLAQAVMLLQRAVWVPTCPGEPECDGPTAMPEHLMAMGVWTLFAGILFVLFSQWVFHKLEGKFAERL